MDCDGVINSEPTLAVSKKGVLVKKANNGGC